MKLGRIVLFSLLLISLALSGLFANGGGEAGEGASDIFNATGFPIVSEKITLETTIIVDKRIANEEKKFFQRMEELTNISWTFMEIPGETLNEKKNLLLASGDYPDVFMKTSVSKADELLYGPQGVFVALEDMIAEHAPNFSAVAKENPAVKRIVTTPEGHQYSFPAVTAEQAWVFPLVNVNWLDTLGLDKPSDLDEFYEMLVAFRDGDPNGNGKADEIPLSLQGNPDMYFAKCLGNSWGLLFGLNNMMTEGDKVIFSPTEPEFKDMLAYLKKLYDENLLDPEIFTHNTEQFQAKGRGEEQLLGTYNHLAPFLVVGGDREFDYAPILPFEYKGERMINTNAGLASGALVITDRCEYPEAVVRWADYLYSEEGGIAAWMGIEGTEYSMNGDGTWNWILGDGENQQDIRKYLYQGGASIPCRRPDLWTKINDPLEKSVVKNRGAHEEFLRISYPDAYFTTEEQKDLSVLSADINPYVAQYMVQVILGETNLNDGWDNYIDTLNKMGLEEMIEIQQKAFTGYINN